MREPDQTVIGVLRVAARHGVGPDTVVSWYRHGWLPIAQRRDGVYTWQLGAIRRWERAGCPRRKP